VYAAVLAVAGIAAGAYLIASGSPATWELQPVVWLGLLAIAGPVLSVSRQGYLPSRIVHQIGSAFAYALFFLAPPGAACAVLWATALADWALNRRRPIQAAFNLGQFGLAILAATLVRSWLMPGFSILADVNARTIAVAIAALLAFFLVNQGLTRGILSLLSGQPLHRLRTLSGPALSVEVLCIVSGIGMAVFWQMAPWLMLLGVIPIWVFMLLLSHVSQREQELERREEDLHALQVMGLQIGSELDVERVRQSVVRVATEALKVRGALLLTLDPERRSFVVMAHEGIDVPPPESLPRQRIDDALLAAGVRVVADFASERSLWPELEFLEAEGMLLAPLAVGERSDSLLVLFHGAGRRAFDDGDARRAQVLLRFVHTALTNAELVRELRDVQEHLAQAEKMSAMGMLVSGVAHELNNPLTTVLGYSSLLLDQEDDAAKRRMLDRVLGEADRAGKIVHNLLTFSRKRKPERRLTDMAELIEQVLGVRERELRLHNVQVVRRFARDLPPVLIDPHQFQQVFLNLLQNAQDALGDGHRRGRIVVETRDRGGWVQVVVSDDGPGIPAHQIKKVFLPFFTTKGVGRGTGLGLSICYGIVHEHGGRIDVESREGEGASFLLEIPTARRQVDAGTVAAELALPPLPPARTGGRLLVVDDDAAIADMVREALELEGWTVVTAAEGGEALDLVADAEFDALLVDLRMPGMDGRTFYEHLRLARPDLEARVVFATGDTGGENVSRFLEESGKTVLGKPYEIRDLMEAISKIAGGSSQVN